MHQLDSRALGAGARRVPLRGRDRRLPRQRGRGVFFGSLKNEWYHRFTFGTRARARMAVVWHIESFYSRMRPHSSVGWRRRAELMGEFFVRFDSGLEEAQMAA